MVDGCASFSAVIDWSEIQKWMIWSTKVIFSAKVAEQGTGKRNVATYVFIYIYNVTLTVLHGATENAGPQKCRGGKQR